MATAPAIETEPVDEISRARHSSTPDPSAAYDGCKTDRQINDRYKTLFAEAQAKHGEYPPSSVVANLQEDLRRAHVRLIGRSVAVAEKRARAKRPIEGRCQHCGEPTKGGLFAAGHDAKLKGELIRAGLEGDHEAVAEMMARGPAWFKKPERFDPNVVRRADEIIQSTPTHEFLARRVAQRLEGQ